MSEQSDGSRSGLLRTAAHYSVGSALGLLASVARVAIAARLLPHDLSGKWLGLQLVLNYGQNLHLGVLFGMFRNIPLLRARGDGHDALALQRTCLTFLVIVSAGASVATVLWALLSTTIERRYIVETGLLTVLNLLRSYYVTLFRAESRFRALSISSALGGVVSVFSLVFIWRFMLDGLICGMALQAAVELAYLAFHDSLPVLKLHLGLLGQQFGVGVLTLLTSIGTTLLTSIDRTVMLRVLGATTTGYYYLGANAIVFFPLLAGLPAAVITPRFFERVGRGESLMSLVEEPVRAAAVALAVTIGAGILSVPAIVAHLWPALVLGNGALYVALLATFPLVLSGLVTNVFYALNRLALQIAILAASSLVSYCSATLSVHVHRTLTSVAFGSSLGIFAYYIGVVFAAFALMGQRGTSALRLLAESFLPFVAAMGLVFLLRLGARLLWTDVSIVGMVVTEVVFIGVMTPWMLSAFARLRGTRSTVSTSAMTS